VDKGPIYHDGLKVRQDHEAFFFESLAVGDLPLE
jgi:hypothetical protein